MAATNANKRWFLVGALSLALGVLLLILLPICGCQRGSESRQPEGAPALDVNSTNLPRTCVVATLDAPLLPGTNLIWCASFQLAWKEFATALKQKQPVVESAETLCGQLNAAPDPRPFLPNANYYAAAGNVADGIVTHIQQEMRQKFPAAPLPDFGPLTIHDLVAYGYLEANVAFAIPYFNSKQSVDFTDSTGSKMPIKTFGIRKEDDYAYYSLRHQVEVLFGKDHGLRGGSGEFAVDVCKESPEIQIVVASVEPAGTLAGTLLKIDQLTQARPRNQAELHDYYHDFGPNDTLLIPEMNWRILHHFAELEGHLLANSSRQGQPMTMAVQGITFRLDRGGASLSSEAKILVLPIPTHFEFTKPFLVLLKKRGASHPFFVAWIDNAELLRRWE